MWDYELTAADSLPSGSAFTLFRFGFENRCFRRLRTADLLSRRSLWRLFMMAIKLLWGFKPNKRAAFLNQPPPSPRARPIKGLFIFFSFRFNEKPFPQTL